MRGETSTAIFVLALLTLSACSDFSPGDRVTSCEETKGPKIKEDEKSRESYFDLKIMTYNVKGLPYPIATERAQPLTEIKNRINHLLSVNGGPDILVVQEMFSDEAISILKDVNYSNFIYGPTKFDVRGGGIKTVRLIGLDVPLAKFQPSGLAIFSRYPIQSRRKRPFRFSSCAGFDCLANKGALLAYVAIPGVPIPIVVATTHMNAQDVSNVPEPVHRRAHQKQTVELAQLLNEFSGDNPLIVAGDFNMEKAPKRFNWFREKIPYLSAHHYCQRNPDRCVSGISLRNPEPWLETQDLQFYRTSKWVSLRPQALDIMFPEAIDGLSDHDAQIVNWRISWPKLMKPLPGACNYEAPEFENSLPKAGV